MLNLIEKIDHLIQQGITEGVFPGANYCFILGEKTYYGSFGKRALFPEVEENTIDTVYDIASLSKVIATTSAVLKLAEAGELHLDDKISKYLPFITNDVVTIKHLLTHSSGYPALTPNTETMTSVEPLLADLYTCQLEYEPGSKVVYSDVGFMYLGFIVDHITRSMPQFLEENFFKPLEMKDTCYNHKAKKRIAPTEDFGFRGMIRGECHDEKGYLLNGVAGHAGIFSTVKDLGIFAQMLLNHGVFNSKIYYHETSMAAIQEKYILSDVDEYRSLGWNIRSIHGNEVIYHNGYTGTSFLVDFKNNLSFILLSNRVHPTRTNTKIIDFRKKLEKVIYEDEMR